MAKQIVDPIKALDMKEKGMTWAEIGKIFGVSGPGAASAVRNYRKKLGIHKPIPSTHPWEASENPFVPDIFKLDNKKAIKRKKDWSPRFADKDRLDKWLDQGYRIANVHDWTDNPEVLRQLEEGQIDSTLKRRGMILVEMPMERFKKKQKWLKDRTDQRSGSGKNIAQKAAQDLKSDGVDMDLRDLSE